MFGRRRKQQAGSAKDPIVQALGEMIEVYEDLDQRLGHMSLPNPTFAADLWPPPGSAEQVMKLADF